MNWQMGKWKVHNPHIVVKLGFVVEDVSLPSLNTVLWPEAELEAKARLGKFEATDLFHQEDKRLYAGAVFSARWYTPIENRTLISDLELEGVN